MGTIISSVHSPSHNPGNDESVVGILTLRSVMFTLLGTAVPDDTPLMSAGLDSLGMAEMVS